MPGQEPGTEGGSTSEYRMQILGGHDGADGMILEYSAIYGTSASRCPYFLGLPHWRPCIFPSTRHTLCLGPFALVQCW